MRPANPRSGSKQSEQTRLKRDRFKRLIATRDQLAAVLAGDPPAHAMAGLAREYRLLLDAIMATQDPTQQKVDAVDQLAARRKAKTAARARRQA